MFVSVLCLMLKVGLSVYTKMVEWQQNQFLEWDYCKQYEDSESVVSNLQCSIIDACHSAAQRYTYAPIICAYHRKK